MSIYLAYALVAAGAVVGTILCIVSVSYKTHWTRLEKIFASLILASISLRLALSIFTVLNESVVVNASRGPSQTILPVFGFLILQGALVWAAGLHGLYVRFFERGRDSA